MEQKRRKVGELHSPPMICSECCQASNLIQCTGDCKRFFHAKCVKAVIFPGEDWLCPDCSKHVHRCNHCLQYAPDHELVQCKDPYCLQYYHKTKECGGLMSCVGDGGSFICKRHICALCRRSASSTSPLLMCFRCTKSYHVDCCPSEVCNLYPNVILCMHHHLDRTPFSSIPMEVLQARQS